MSVVYGTGTPKLGFGLMRLPRKGLSIDVEQVKAMTDLFMEAGFTYFDTAFLYPGSEAAIRRALVERYPRDSYTLATKLNTMVALTERSAKKQLYTSLERTGAGYFDYYLRHSLMENNYSKYDRFRMWDFVGEQKAEGVLKNIGFSFHAGPRLLDRLLTEHPEVDFVQLQLNYADWENPKVTSRANYETARKHGKPIVVMEPVKGGRLADPPADVKKLFEAIHPDMSPASWAIRFAASLDGILTVLSGMSNVAQMEDNLSYMKDFRPLDGEEQQAVREAQRLLGRSSAIPCTACRYCVEGCPKQIPIPEIFAAMNLQLGNGQMTDAREAFAKAVTGGHGPKDCAGCRRCEQACPQHLPITDHLRQAADMFPAETKDEA